MLTTIFALSLGLSEPRCDYEGKPLHEPVMVSAPTVDAEILPLPDFSDAIATARERAGDHDFTVAVLRPGEPIFEYRTDPDGRQYHWASVGKNFTATVVLQLVTEGKLSLDQTIETWFPDLPYAAAISIRDLLSHTGGAYNLYEDPDQDPASEERQGYAGQGYFFCPGRQWKYSNHGYELLGQIISAVEGKSWREAIKDRLLLAHHLGGLTVIDPDNKKDVIFPDGAPIDAAAPGPAGAIAGSAADMARYWQGHASGRLLAPEMQAQLLATPYPMWDDTSFYGLGTMLWDMPDEDLLLFGHAGGVMGMNSVAFHSPADNVTIAVSVAGPTQAAAIANLFLAAIRGE